MLQDTSVLQDRQLGVYFIQQALQCIMCGTDYTFSDQQARSMQTVQKTTIETT